MNKKVTKEMLERLDVGFCLVDETDIPADEANGIAWLPVSLNEDRVIFTPYETPACEPIIMPIQFWSEEWRQENVNFAKEFTEEFPGEVYLMSLKVK